MIESIDDSITLQEVPIVTPNGDVVVRSMSIEVSFVAVFKSSNIGYDSLE